MYSSKNLKYFTILRKIYELNFLKYLYHLQSHYWNVEMSDFNPIISFQSLNIEAMPKCSDKIVINPIQIEFIEVKEDDTDDRLMEKRLHINKALDDILGVGLIAEDFGTEGPIDVETFKQSIKSSKVPSHIGPERPKILHRLNIFI